MATNYGSGTDGWISDMPLVWAQTVDPIRIVANRIARRLTTPRGALAYLSDDADFGWDVRQLINKKLRTSDILVAQGAIENEILKDEQVESATVAITPGASKVSVSISCDGATGPFTLTLVVGSLTTDLIFG